METIYIENLSNFAVKGVRTVDCGVDRSVLFAFLRTIISISLLARFWRGREIDDLEKRVNAKRSKILEKVGEDNIST